MLFQNKFVKLQVKVNGMHCGMCAANLKRALSEETGVKKAEVSFENGSAEITFDPGKTTEKALRAAIAEAGYEAV